MDQTDNPIKFSIEDPLDVEKNQPSETTFYCTVCYDKFSDSNSFSSHMDKVHNKKIYACSVCHKRYKSKRSYNLHIESAHKEELGSKVPFWQFLHSAKMALLNPCMKFKFFFGQKTSFEAL